MIIMLAGERLRKGDILFKKRSRVYICRSTFFSKERVPVGYAGHDTSQGKQVQVFDIVTRSYVR